MTPTFELARKALAFLEHHRLEPSAVNYDLSLSYLMNRNSDLAREIDAQTEGGVRLTSASALELVERFLFGNPKVMVGHRERTVAQQTEELGTLTSGAQELTSDLGRDVGRFIVQASEWPTETSDFVTRLSDAERELAELRSNVAKLQVQIGAGGADHIRGHPERDGLTQALNQAGAEELLENLTSDGRDYVMLMFSLDALVELNERYGRSVGDNVVNALASTLRQIFQEQELIRWSGNEFVAVMRHTAVTPARVMAEEALVTMAARRLKLRGTGEWIGVVTASAGISVSHGETATSVMERARRNVHLAAASGGNKVEG